MKKKKRKKKLNNKNINKKIYSYIFVIFMLFLLIAVVGYLFFGTDTLKTSVNTTTASYISFNNRYDSDTIKIDSLEKYSDLKGKLSKSIDFSVDSDSNIKYEVVLLPINVTVDYKNIKVYLTDEYNSKLVFKSLNKFHVNEDGGIVIYSDEANKNKVNNLKLRVWVDNNYKKDLKANSFEVKVRLR